jgi:threonine synthase
MYFENSFPTEYNISPNPDYINTPVLVLPEDLEQVPAPGKPLKEDEFKKFVKRVSEEIARALNLTKVEKT